MVFRDRVTNLKDFIFVTTVTIVTKVGRAMNCLKGLLVIKSHDLLTMWSCEVTWQVKIDIPQLKSPTTVPMAAKKKQGGDLVQEAPIYKATWFVSHVVLWDQVTNSKQHISITTVLMATKLGIVETYHQGLLTITSHDSSFTWSWEVTFQIKYFISTPALYQLC